MQFRRPARSVVGAGLLTTVSGGLLNMRLLSSPVQCLWLSRLRVSTFFSKLASALRSTHLQQHLTGLQAELAAQSKDLTEKLAAIVSWIGQPQRLLKNCQRLVEIALLNTILRQHH